MGLLDKLAKAFGFKSDEDLKKKQEQEEKMSASKKESVGQYHKDLTFDWEQALKNREPLDTMSTFYVGKATYKSVLMIAKANKFDFDDEYFQHIDYDDTIDETVEPYKSLLKRFKPAT